MKDLGDSFEWTFDKGSMSMDDYLKTLSSKTGISETFWASMIESLGMYSDELAKWTETNEEVDKNIGPTPEEAAAKGKEVGEAHADGFNSGVEASGGYEEPCSTTAEEAKAKG